MHKTELGRVETFGKRDLSLQLIREYLFHDCGYTRSVASRNISTGEFGHPEIGSLFDGTMYHVSCFYCGRDGIPEVIQCRLNGVLI